MKKTLSILLSIILALCTLSAMPAFATENAVSVTISGTKTDFSFEGNEISYALNDAFSFCRDNASASTPATIAVPTGEYSVEKVIRVADYTTLNLTGVTLVKGNTGDKNVLMSPNYYNPAGGYGALSKFSLIGGTLKYSDDYDKSHCLIRIAHANSIVIDGTSFMNSVDSHDIEIAACNNFVIKNCLFSGQKVYAGQTSLEALQIDILEEAQHFVGMAPYDDTMNNNITVQNCKFKDLYRAVGTHSSFEGLYQTGINIINNRFENITSTAITCSNYINSKITGNTLIGCGEGIHFYMMKKDSELDKICKPSVKTPAPNKNCNTLISQNTISVSQNSVSTTASPLYIYGNNVTADKTTRIASANYGVYGLKVTNNNIVTDGYGIRAYDTLNSYFNDNVISYYGASSGKYGILFGTKSSNNTVNSNSFSKFEGAIIVKESSKVASIDSNTISNTTGNAIVIKESSYASKINANNINKSTKNGILVYEKASAGSITNNLIASCQNGISIETKANSISGNTLKTNKAYGIYLNTNASANVYTNTFTDNKSGKCYKKGSTSYKFGNIATPSYKLSQTKYSTKKKDKDYRNVVIKWTIPSTTSTYYIYRSTSKDGTYKKLGTISSSKGKYTDKKIKKGKKYYYKIRAIKTMGSSKAYSKYSSKKYIKLK